MFKSKRYALMDEAGEGGGGGGGAAAAAATGAGTGEGAAAGAGASTAGEPASLLAGVTSETSKAGTGTGTDDPLAWLPEKHRVNDAAGKLDEAASARKLAEAYKHLETKLGNAAVLPPATAEEYKLEPIVGADGKPVEGIDLEGFAADPMFKTFAAGAHAAGMNNAQLNYAVAQYLQIAPQLVAANQTLSVTEAKAELGKLWTDDTAMNAGLRSSLRAIHGFGGQAGDMPGAAARLEAKYGSDPDFIAFTAAIGREMAEDKLPSGMVAKGQPTDQDIAELQQSKAYWDATDPAHARIKQQVTEHYARKYGSGKG